MGRHFRGNTIKMAEIERWCLVYSVSCNKHTLSASVKTRAKKEADEKEWMAHVIEDNLGVIHDETGKLHEQFATQTQSRLTHT